MNEFTLPPSLEFCRSGLLQGQLRRAPILNQMGSLMGKGVSCQGCSGPCCTFQKNSMQLTPLEALELYLFLQKENRLNEQVLKDLEDCIEEFRLDVRPSTGGGALMRKTYTCPFFAHQALGCTIAPESKPYGCLGFNPTIPGEVEGKSCRSDTDLLIKRESLHPEEDTQNQKLREVLGLPWEKETIPQSLLAIHQVWQRLCNS